MQFINSSTRTNCPNFKCPLRHPLQSTTCPVILPYLSEIWRMSVHLRFSCLEISVDMLQALVQSFSGPPFWLHILNIPLTIRLHKLSGLFLQHCLQQYCPGFFWPTQVYSSSFKMREIFVYIFFHDLRHKLGLFSYVECKVFISLSGSHQFKFQPSYFLC